VGSVEAGNPEEAHVPDRSVTPHLAVSAPWVSRQLCAGAASAAESSRYPCGIANFGSQRWLCALAATKASSISCSSGVDGLRQLPPTCGISVTDFSEKTRGSSLGAW